MQSKKFKINKIIPNKDNPRTIKDEKFKKLVKSILEFPEMLELRPIVVNEKMVILGGNMRYSAAKEAGLKELPVVIAKGLSEAQQREFIIKDNTSGGEWDWEQLHEDWDIILLDDWGMDVLKYADKNKEIDVNEFPDLMTMKFELTEEQHAFVLESLSGRNVKKELALLMALGYES